MSPAFSVEFRYDNRLVCHLLIWMDVNLGMQRLRIAEEHPYLKEEDL